MSKSFAYFRCSFGSISFSFTKPQLCVCGHSLITIEWVHQMQISNSIGFMCVWCTDWKTIIIISTNSNCSYYYLEPSNDNDTQWTLQFKMHCIRNCLNDDIKQFHTHSKPNFVQKIEGRKSSFMITTTKYTLYVWHWLAKNGFHSWLFFMLMKSFGELLYYRWLPWISYL